jgi:hypothetical protein
VSGKFFWLSLLFDSEAKSLTVGCSTRIGSNLTWKYLLSINILPKAITHKLIGKKTIIEEKSYRSKVRLHNDKNRSKLVGFKEQKEFFCICENH